MNDKDFGSRPRYVPLRVDGDRLRALIVVDTVTIPQPMLAPGMTRDAFGERWMVQADSRAIPSPEPGGDQYFRSPDHLLIALDHRLSRETMGLRLYAAGGEAFVWDVRNVAARFGMGPDEISLFALSDGSRRVRCTHCRTVTPDVRTTIAICVGCGAALVVRDHFSRRLNAYAGVQADAEMPGDIPGPEALNA